MSKNTSKTKKTKKLAAEHPWLVTAKEVRKFLGADPEITVHIDKDTMCADIITGNQSKEDSLFDLLVDKPLTWEDGATLTLMVNSNPKSYSTTCEVKDYERAFRDNPYFSHTEKDRTDAYVMWNPIPIQVACNNLQDPNGFEHIMPTDLAQRIFQPCFAHGTEPLRSCFCL